MAMRARQAFNTSSTTNDCFEMRRTTVCMVTINRRQNAGREKGSERATDAKKPAQAASRPFDPSPPRPPLYSIYTLVSLGKVVRPLSRHKSALCGKEKNTIAWGFWLGWAAGGTHELLPQFFVVDSVHVDQGSFRHLRGHLATKRFAPDGPKVAIYGRNKQTKYTKYVVITYIAEYGPTG